jgi:hypothetical protein
MQPIVMRLLGASAPKADEGTIAGRPTATDAAAAAELLRNSRRVTVCAFFAALFVIILPFSLFSQAI